MKSSVLYGGDLHSALDWLCLNLKDGDRASSPLDIVLLYCSPEHKVVKCVNVSVD